MMNFVTSRFLSISRTKCLDTPSRIVRTLSGGIISKEPDGIAKCYAETGASLPDNVVVLGVNKEKLEMQDYRTVDDPVASHCEIVRTTSDYLPHLTPPLVWLHSFESCDFDPHEAIELHPEIFACHPRMDFLHRCKEWQEKFREVDYSWAPTRAEMGRGRKKPWPQKGTGRARHGSTVAPQWKNGGIAHGPRGPRPLFQKILPSVKLSALTSALTIKRIQNNLLIAKDFELSSPDPLLFQEILTDRGVGDKSALLVFADSDNLDESSNVFSVVADWPKVNLMPLIAMNVWSLLHHEWLILSSNALDELERKVSWHLHRYSWIEKPHNYYQDLPFEVREFVPESDENY